MPHKDPKAARESKRRYAKSATRKEQHKRYQKTAKYKEYREKLYQDPARKEYQRRYSREYMRRKKGLPVPTYAPPARCEICGRLPQQSCLALDHDHATGKFRGWLCTSCNTSLGKFEDNPVWLERAATYVRNGGICA